jgi:hypothetical protein
VYGLKQAPKNRNKTITTWLDEYGFSQSKVDPGIYVFCKADDDFYILALYVADNIIVGSTSSFMSEFKTASGRRFDVQYVGPVSWLLGIAVERDRGNHTIKIDHDIC